MRQAQRRRKLEKKQAMEFLSAKSFAGSMPGYVFKAGASGLGYYRDELQDTPPPTLVIGTRVIGGAGSEAGKLQYPEGVAVDGAGNVIVHLGSSGGGYDAEAAAYSKVQKLMALTGIEDVEARVILQENGWQLEPNAGVPGWAAWAPPLAQRIRKLRRGPLLRRQLRAWRTAVRTGHAERYWAAAMDSRVKKEAADSARRRRDLQLAFAMGTHARLGAGTGGAEGNSQGCPYLMMPADLVERILGLACDQQAGDGVSAKPMGEDMKRWKGTISGPKDTPYDGGTFVIDIELTSSYPFEPPKMKFDTKVWHPCLT